MNLTKLDDATSALRALNVMVTTLLETNDGYGNIAGGVYLLFSQQCDLLEQVFDDAEWPAKKNGKIAEAVAAERMAAELRTAAASRMQGLAQVDPATAERIEREDRERAEHERIAHQAARMDAELAGHDPHYSADELRAKAIADMMRRGAEVPTIAEALNMKQPAVSKLVAQMLGEATASPPASPPRRKASGE